MISQEDKYKSALISLVMQFGYSDVKDGKPVIHTGGLSALEETFEVLGWEDPHILIIENDIAHHHNWKEQQGFTHSHKRGNIQHGHHGAKYGGLK